MDVNDLEHSIVNYLNAQKTKEVNRDMWDDKVKDMIIDCCKEVVNRWQIGLETETDNNPNLNAIYLFFTPTISEYIGFNGGKKIKLSKINGVMVFSQTFNGEISIKIEYPTIEIIKPEKKFRILNIVAPSKLNKTFVINMIGDFIQEMAVWESTN